VQLTPLARFLGWARFSCPAAQLTARRSAGGRVNARRGGAVRRAPACAGGSGRVGAGRRPAAGPAAAVSTAGFWQPRRQ